MYILLIKFELSDKTLLWNDQDNDKYFFYNLESKEITDTFILSSAYSQILNGNDGL